MYQMTETERAERATIKALHACVRSDMRAASGTHEHRYMLLAWAYIRGLPFRRIERTHHVQIVDGKPYEHNMPSAFHLTMTLAKYLPELASDMGSKWSVKRGCRVELWLADPRGASPAPPPRAKKPYVRPMAAE